MLVMWFSMSTVNPVQDVKSSISTHKKDVVSRQVFYFTVTLQDDKLGQNGNGFQVNRECPKKLHNVKVIKASSDQVCDDGNDQTRSRSKFPMQEGILRLVIGRLDWLLELDGVNDGGSRADVQDLH